MAEEEKMEVEGVNLEDAPAVSPQNREQLDWSWKREAMQAQKARINVYTRFSIIQNIKTKLQGMSDEVYQQFVGSCFGHFLQFHSDGYSCNAALHTVLAHEIIKTNALDDEIWFRIGDQSIRFSKYEYALVTGLRFRDSTFNPSETHDPPAAGVYIRHFHGQHVLVDRLRMSFIDGQFRRSPGDALRVAKVLFLYYMLLGVDGRHTLVDRWVWALVEDTDRWENFPWGKYTLQTLLRYIRNIPVSLAAGEKLPTYHFYGCSIALLIWAYEAIPDLGNTCGKRVSPDAVPRCLRWQFPKKLLDMTGFFNPQMACLAALEPSMEEQQRDYWQHLGEMFLFDTQHVHQESTSTRCRSNTATTTNVGARRPQRSIITRGGVSKRPRRGFSTGGVVAVLGSERLSPILEHGGDVPHSSAQDSMDTMLGGGPDANDLHDVHDMPVGTDWETFNADLDSAVPPDESSISEENSLLTRLIQGLTPVIQQEVNRSVAVAIERLVPTIIQRELNLFFSNRDFCSTFVSEESSLVRLGPTTTPFGVVPPITDARYPVHVERQQCSPRPFACATVAAGDVPPSMRAAPVLSDDVLPSTSAESMTLVEQQQLSLTISSSVAESSAEHSSPPPSPPASTLAQSSGTKNG